jgi:hypothetical protein
MFQYATETNKWDKKQHFHNQRATSSNKVKGTWKIIKKNSGNSQSQDRLIKINCSDKLLQNTKEIADAFNKSYTQTVTNLTVKHSDICKSFHY